jgi:hypothetical protein
MSSAAHPQPEDEQVGAVVSVRGDSLREARTGLVVSLCLLAVLVAIHPGWKIFVGFAVGHVLSAFYSAVKDVLTFRGRLDEAEPLPMEAVEATGRPKRPPLDRKQALGMLVAIAVLAGAVTFGGSEWIAATVAGAVAGAVSHRFIRPLGITYVAARWEIEHGHRRLYRPLAQDEDGEETLYIADRPVPAA